jgi:penicillin amidase
MRMRSAERSTVTKAGVHSLIARRFSQTELKALLTLALVRVVFGPAYGPWTATPRLAAPWRVKRTVKQASRLSRRQLGRLVSSFRIPLPARGPRLVCAIAGSPRAGYTRAHIMRRFLRRALLIVFTLGVELPLVALAALVLWLGSGLPTTMGTLAAPGLGEPVEIVRDAHGVAHIFAPSADAAWFAQGYVHAQERLAQMEFMRRFGAGRLSETIGRAALDIDRLMRLFGLADAAQASYSALSPSAQRVLDQYAAGVNAYIDTHSGAWPPELMLLGIRPEPWEPRDSLLFGQIMGMQLTGNWRNEIARARLWERLTPAQRAELWPDWPADQATVLREAAALFRTLDLDGLARALPYIGPDRASNEWVVGGARSATGRPLLVNDPHLSLTAPGQWYLVHIVAPGLTLAGASAPGVPGVLLGHNGRIAWGFTTTGGDAMDLFVERLDPADPERYMTESGSEPFRVRLETIRVKGEADVRFPVRTTRNGRVISDINQAARASAPEGHVLAVAFTRFNTVDRTPEALFALQAARDWNSFVAALRDWQAPMQNIVYADVDGNIGFIAPALLPLRGAGDGSVPLPGWIAANRWRGTVPFDELPRVFNPPSGRLANSNNRIVPDEYPVMITRDWDAPYRGQRAVELLDARPTHDVASMEAILADPVSRFARDLLPLMLRVTPTTELGRSALALLRGWDGAMRRDLPQPLIFTAWTRLYARNLLADAIGDAEFGREASTLLRAAFEGRSSFCPDAAACRTRAAAALDEAMSEVATRYGGDPRAWRWGVAHYAPFGNAVFERIPVLRDVFGFRVATDGDYYTVNRGATRGGTGELAYTHVLGAGYRAIYDMANLDRSVFIATPGQSGNPLSPHWGDLAGLWANGRHFTIAGTREELARTGEVLQLMPGGRPLREGLGTGSGTRVR